MASTEVGAAHVGIYPKIDASSLNSVKTALAQTFTGNTLNVAKAAFKGIATSISAVGAGLTGLAASGGLSRALNIEQAQTMFKGLNLNWNDFYSTIMSSVDGTAYGFDVAATAAAQLAASGVSAGSDMEKALNGCVGASATFGTDLGDLSGIWAKVAASGKLTGETVMQFTDRGINAVSVLSQYLGKSTSEVSAMVSAGQISFDIFSNAMYSAFGDSAKAANNTFTGSLANMKAALSKIGQDWLTPLKDSAIPVFNSIKNVFNSCRTALQPLATSFGAFLGVSYDAQGNLTRTSGATESLCAFLDNLATKIQSVDLTNLSGGAKAAAAALGALGAVSLGGLISQVPIVGDVFNGLTGNITGALSNLGSNITQNLGGALSTASSAAAKAGGGFKGLGAGIGAIASPVNIIMAALAALAAIFVYCYTTNEGFRNSVNGLISAIAAGLAPAFSSLQTLGQPLAAMFSALCNIGMQIIQVILQVAAALAPIISTLISMVVPILNMIISVINAILSVVQSVLTVILGVIQTVLPPIITIINAALTVILAIIQVVMPIIQTIITTAMSVIQGVIDTVWPHIQSIIESVMGVIQSIIQIVTSAISGDWSGVWNGICSLFQNIWNVIKSVVSAAIGIVKSVIQNVLNTISSIWNGAWNAIGSFLQGAWDGITNAVSSGIDGVINFFTNMPQNIMNALGDLGSLLVNAGKDIIDGFLNGVKNAFKGVTDFFGGVADTIASLKGPKPYDLRVLIPNGQWLMQSLCTGLNRGMKGVRETLSNITAEISDFGFSGAMDNAIENVKSGVETIAEMVNGSTYGMQLQTAGASAYSNSTGLYNSSNGFQPLVINVNNAEVNSRPEMEKAAYDLLFELRRYGYTQGAK